MKAISTRALRFRDPAAEALTDNFVASDDPEWQVLETGASWEDSNAVMFTKTPSTDSRFSGGIKKLSKKAVKLIRLPSKDRLPLLKVQDKECNYACLNDSLENPPGENEETDGFNFWSQQPAEETQEKPKRVKSLKKLLKLKRGKSLVDDKEDDQNPILQVSALRGPRAVEDALAVCGVSFSYTYICRISHLHLPVLFSIRLMHMVDSILRVRPHRRTSGLHPTFRWRIHGSTS